MKRVKFIWLTLFLTFFATFSFAETRPADLIAGSSTYTCGTGTGSTWAAACTAGGGFPINCNNEAGNRLCFSTSSGNGVGSCPYGYNKCPSEANSVPVAGPSVYACPEGQNWSLSGSTCSRPDCVSPQTRQSDGTCSMPQCASSANAVLGTTRYQTSPSAGLYCVNNCLAYSAGDTNTVNGIKYQQMFVNGAGGAASSCTGSETVPVATPNPTSSHDVPCSQGEGVLTMGGKVQCVPASTPSATSPPVVSTKSSTDTKSDGSKIITTTTNTCTGDGACSTVTSTTVTNNTAGAPGLAGTPGTSINNANSPSAPTSDFCAANPSLQMCKGNMNEEATQKKVLEQLTAATAPEMADQKALVDAAKTTNQKSADDLQAAIQNDFSNNKSLWFSWVWTPPVGSCAPSTNTVHGVGLSLDYCGPVGLINSIIGWLFALYGAIEVYGQLFRRENA